MNKPTIDLNKCVGCGVCVRECAANCITMAVVQISDTKKSVRAVIDYDQCVDCLTCSEACPAGAIR